VAQGKPAQDVYLRAAELCEADPRRCLAIEDSRTGVQSAVNAGMRVIAVPDHHDHQDGFTAAWKIYPSLVQVQDDLDELLSQAVRP
jgi:beta-phosphoglucomutase-like phosphatase (HAD superfamily)